VVNHLTHALRGHAIPKQLPGPGQLPTAPAQSRALAAAKLIYFAIRDPFFNRSY